MSPIQFSVVPEGTPWPNGDYHNIAVLTVSATQVQQAVGASLLHGIEEGLGPWTAIGIRLPCGATIELINYQESPRPGFIARAEIGFDPGVVLSQTLAALGIGRNSVSWLGPKVKG